MAGADEKPSWKNQENLMGEWHPGISPIENIQSGASLTLLFCYRY